jgi:hypothetical protein
MDLAVIDKRVRRPHGEFQMFATGLVDQHGVAVMHAFRKQHTCQLVPDFGLHQPARKGRAP